jgi:hypothetical protein
MISMTIQTLEVQRMTLSTLQELKVPVDALKDALKAQPASAPSDQAAGVNPMAWWGTLTEQFTTLASQAVAASQEAMDAAAKPASPVSPTATKAASAKAKPKSSRASAAPRKSARRV